jgi:hypothetical protein
MGRRDVAKGAAVAAESARLAGQRVERAGILRPAGTVGAVDFMPGDGGWQRAIVNPPPRPPQPWPSQAPTAHDRFNAILGALQPAEFEQCLLSWITALHEITDGKVVPIDGKSRGGGTTTRPAASRPFTWSAPGPRHTTSAWVKQWLMRS